MFFSDRNHGILEGVRSVFPDSPYAFCYVHLKANLNNRFRGYRKVVQKSILSILVRVRMPLRSLSLRTGFSFSRMLVGRRQLHFGMKLQMRDGLMHIFQDKCMGILHQMHVRSGIPKFAMLECYE